MIELLLVRLLFMPFINLIHAYTAFKFKLNTDKKNFPSVVTLLKVSTTFNHKESENIFAGSITLTPNEIRTNFQFVFNKA